MNYLAHLYLSGEDEDIIVGNFIGDYVKGNKYNKYPDKIRRGILLHRMIDNFTNNHAEFREAKKLLAPEYRLYSGIVIDLFYDHFLAKNWNDYSEISLRKFAGKIHSILLSNFRYLPVRVQGFLPVLIQNRRLESYASQQGIQKSLEIMSRYTSLPDNSEKAAEILRINFEYFENNFASFMRSLIGYVEQESGIKIHLPNPEK